MAQAADTATSDTLQELHCLCDSDKYGIWGIFASAALYVGFALYSEYYNGGSKRVVVIREDTSSVRRPLPAQAEEEVRVSHMDSSEYALGMGEKEAQNVKFVDTHPGFTHETTGYFDEVRDHAFVQDAKLQDFFSRPVLVQTAEWPVAPSNLTQVTIDPWTLFFEDPKVINRLANYRLLRCKLHVKFTISATPFHYGRVLVDYLPFASQDDLSSIRNPYVDGDFVLATQRPHIFLNPTESQGGEMVLPFFYHKNAMDITRSEWQDMGRLTISQFSQLKSASSTTDPVTIKVYVWAEDVKFAIPTVRHPTLPAQAEDEYQKKPVSYTAGVVAAAASKLASIPPIAPFALATEIGARAVGAMATLFGYSRPNELTVGVFRPRTKADFAVTNAKDDCARLTVDCKQELSIDPRLAGLESIDELGINYIASKESYLESFTWPTNTAPETPLFARIVDPGENVTATENTDTAYYLPACAFASLPFKYWRGSLKYRFQVIASKYHRGRIKVVYDPVSYSLSTDYNEAYTTIIDIAETTDFTITCGWGQVQSYREVMPPDSAVTFSSYSSGIGSASPFGNGTIAVYVVNELSHPDASADIEIKVFVSAGDDFEVAVPHDQYLRQMRCTSSGNLLKPQAEDDGNYTSQPSDPPSVNVIANTSNLTDRTNLVYFGEHIRSFRSLLKRYALSRITVPGVAISGPTVSRTDLDVFPPYPQKYSTAGSFTAGDGDLQESYVGLVTLLNYLSIAYTGWRGSLRYVVDTTGFYNLDFPTPVNSLTVMRSSVDAVESVSSTAIPALSTDANLITAVNLFNGYGGYDGKTMEGSQIQPLTTAEIPYYSNNRFSLTKKKFVPGTATENMQRVKTMVEYYSSGDNTNFLKHHVAVGEDFTMFFYTGPPRLFIQDGIP